MDRQQRRMARKELHTPLLASWLTSVEVEGISGIPPIPDILTIPGIAGALSAYPQPGGKGRGRGHAGGACRLEASSDSAPAALEINVRTRIQVVIIRKHDIELPGDSVRNPYVLTCAHEPREPRHHVFFHMAVKEEIAFYSYTARIRPRSTLGLV